MKFNKKTFCYETRFTCSMHRTDLEPNYTWDRFSILWWASSVWSEVLSVCHSEKFSKPMKPTQGQRSCLTKPFRCSKCRQRHVCSFNLSFQVFRRYLLDERDVCCLAARKNKRRLLKIAGRRCWWLNCSSCCLHVERVWIGFSRKTSFDE